MKKHISILLGLLAVFSSLFISCDENEIDSNICKITVNSEGNGTVSITDYIGTSVNVLIGNRMEVVATPDDGYAFIGWYITGTETPVSINAVFAFTTSESVTLTAKFAKLSDIIICSGGNGSVAFKDATGAHCDFRRHWWPFPPALHCKNAFGSWPPGVGAHELVWNGRLCRQKKYGGCPALSSGVLP